MKKFLLLTIMLGSFTSIFATFTTQGNWRWRKDDGSQTTATWIAAQNTAPVITSYTETIRMRIELYNDPNNVGGTLTDALFEDSSNLPGAHWDTIKVTPDADDAFKLAGSSPFVTDKEATTQQLTSPHSSAFATGKVIVSSEKLPASTVGDNTGTEYEYAIKPTANLQPNVIYYFRVDAANYPAGWPLPSLITGTVLPVSLSGFSIQKVGKKVNLNWLTSFEQNSDRFEVERSSDSRTWNTIATVKGIGNSNRLNNYNTIDVSPLNGINYYRLKQFDINSHFTISEIKSLSFNARSGVIVSVSPNPVSDAINFTLENRNVSNALIVLSDVNGKILHQQRFKNLLANNINQLNIKQRPAAGIYILKVQAEGFSESIKIVIQ